MKFGRHNSNTAAEAYVKFQSDMIIPTSSRVALRLYEILHNWSRLLGAWGPFY